MNITQTKAKFKFMFVERGLKKVNVINVEKIKVFPKKNT